MRKELRIRVSCESHDDRGVICIEGRLPSYSTQRATIELNREEAKHVAAWLQEWVNHPELPLVDADAEEERHQAEMRQ